MTTSFRCTGRIFILILCISSVLIVTAFAENDAVSMQKSLDQGLSQIRSGEYQKAVDTFQIAVQEHPDFATAWAYMGFAFYKLNRYDDAISAYDTAIAVDPGYFFAWNNRARASMDKNRKEIQEMMTDYRGNSPVIASDTLEEPEPAFVSESVVQ